MLALTTNVLFAVIVAGVFAQVAAVAWAGGKVIRPRLARRWKPTRQTPVATLALNVRARRRLRRDYRIALLSARAA